MSIKENFESALLILSFCTNKWRTVNEIIDYFDIPKRTAQRYVKSMIDYGYMERKGFYVAATPKALNTLRYGVES